MTFSRRNEPHARPAPASGRRAPVSRGDADFPDPGMGAVAAFLHSMVPYRHLGVARRGKLPPRSISPLY
ncbi:MULTISPECIES: hypothetical protein [unclassified Roseitalea]|uniref:hypothetical protein n=1 Tax=unclassified Roseitalea TaxID=2639107 RepID=UPI00273E46AF|nr:MULTISPECIES: hypothetical protein [unclassified Roseitalea]